MTASVPIEIGREYIPWAGLSLSPQRRIRVVDEWRPEAVRGAPRYVTYVAVDGQPLEEWMPGSWYLRPEDGKRRCNATEFRQGFRPAFERYVCTAEAPWTPDKGRAQHPAAVHVRDRDYGFGRNTEVLHCPYCDLTFEVELAQ